MMSNLTRHIIQYEHQLNALHLSAQTAVWYIILIF